MSGDKETADAFRQALEDDSWRVTIFTPPANRWQELFARFGVDATRQDARERLIVCMAFALGEARHPVRDEPALPLFQAPSPRNTSGKRAAEKHWAIENMLENARPDAASQDEAYRLVWESMEREAERSGYRSWRSLKSAYLRWVGEHARKSVAGKCVSPEDGFLPTPPQVRDVMDRVSAFNRALAALESFLAQ